MENGKWKMVNAKCKMEKQKQLKYFQSFNLVIFQF